MEDDRGELSVMAGLGPWQYELVYDTDRPTPTAVALHVTVKEGDPNAAITAEALRKAPLRQLQDEAEGQIVERLRERYLPAWLPAEPLFPLRFSTDRHYALLAQAYCQLVADGHPDPAARLTRVLGVSINTTHARLVQARKRGLLEQQGRRARLTRKARQLLATGKEG